MNKTIILIFTLAVLACGKTNKKGRGSDPLKDEIMAIHDEVMPKMGTLRATGIRLKRLADSLSTTDSTRANVYLQLSKDLSNANEGMMAWMRGFEPEFEGTDAEKEKYLLDQKEKIRNVNREMKGALEAGETALKEADQ